MDLERINQALQSYNGQEESMQSVTNVLREELGDNWTETVFTDLQGLPPALKDNLTHAFNYYAATMAWNETQEYLAQKDLTVSDELQQRLPILKHWLDFFGAPGAAAYADLEKKVADLTTPMQDVEPQEVEMPKTTTEEDIPVEQSDVPMADDGVITTESPEMASNDKAIEKAPEEGGPSDPAPEQDPPEVFEIKKVARQIELLNQNEAWLSARCIELKGIEIYAYPFYGFIVDLLRQTLKSIEKLQDNPDIEALLNTHFDGGKQAFEDKKAVIQHEIELAEQNCESAATALISEDTDMDEVRRTLGTIDTSDTVEYIGPAPDGFELLDNDAPLDESAIKEQYQKLEKMDALTGKSDQTTTSADNSAQENASQNTQKGVQRKLSFSLKRKKPTEDAS